ncbi:hypothetical protein H7K32_15410 [Brevibacillus agri]|uniref:hypothetical protein n=1 Tax=Brevibacillus agri TaxID=51101 RepID=UPI001C8D4818|nr:hypothetical protein [Brevibacillus agri]MBY0053038.1 hypothetical protein [Brevibacillus agri]
MIELKRQKPISQIREDERQLAEKDARIAQLEAELTALKDQNAVMQETINFLLGI